MFEELVAEKAQYDEQLVEFVKLYARFIEDAQKCPETAQDRLRMAKFATRVDEAWRLVQEDKREILSRALLAKGLLSKEVETAMRVFDAKIVSLT